MAALKWQNGIYGGLDQERNFDGNLGTNASTSITTSFKRKCRSS